MNKKVEFSFYRLEVWNLGMELVNIIYLLTKKFPDDEKFCLVSQLRRAAISVSLNIAEGSIKRTKKDFASFVRIALGSLMEVTACLDISLNQNYIKHEDHNNLMNLIHKLYFKLIALDKFLLNKDN